VRLFVAAYPPPAAMTALAAALPPWALQWRPVTAEQWHLTLAFLGEVAETQLPELAERLRRAATRSGPLSLALAGAGAFPSSGHARVIWVGLTGDLDGLVRLAERTSAAARRTGIPVERRRYRPHLTLARARAPRGSDGSGEVAALADFRGATWPLAEIVLVRSVLGTQTRHEPIGSWPIRT
jgi:2'-5' RNA ligase